MKHLEYSLKETVSHEITEKRSRFIATAFSITDEKDAKQQILHVKSDHPSASHIVYAYQFGVGNTKLYGLSDDGEPRGTAGRPVLEVLKGSGYTNILITVIRYFGGTKLGTGGLVRAYTRAAQEVLVLGEGEPIVSRETFTITTPYQFFQGIKDILVSMGAIDLQEEFSERVVIKGSLDDSLLSEMDRNVADYTNGTVRGL